jgi:hypothetical protein
VAVCGLASQAIVNRPRNPGGSAAIASSNACTRSASVCDLAEPTAAFRPAARAFVIFRDERLLAVALEVRLSQFVVRMREATDVFSRMQVPRSAASSRHALHGPAIGKADDFCTLRLQDPAYC